MKEWTKEEIRSFRKKLNLSQKGLGDLMGVTGNYIFLLERGDKRPSKMFKLFLNCIEREQENEKEVKHGKRDLPKR